MWFSTSQQHMQTFLKSFFGSSILIKYYYNYITIINNKYNNINTDHL
ncbi:hypothetical protein BCVP_CDS0165 [Bacillus phage BC-VP]|nr:hypothetical protein BCVP_CDS0165 [Bacillus phage BC-VP]